MKAVAKLNNVPTSPRKMRLVVDMIRGMDVNEALNVLRHTPKESAKRVEKLVQSAMYNWEQANEGARVEDSELFIAKASVDSGRQLKRYRPAPHGRAHRIRKRSNHVTIEVDSRSAIQEVAPKAKAAPKKEEPKKDTPKKAATKKTTTAKKDTSKTTKSTSKKETPKKDNSASKE